MKQVLMAGACALLLAAGAPRAAEIPSTYTEAAQAKVAASSPFPDRNEKTYLTVANGVLIHQPIAAPGPVDATFTVNRADFLASILTGASLAPKVASGQATVEGDPGALLKLVSWMDKPAPNFPIVTR